MVKIDGRFHINQVIHFIRIGFIFAGDKRVHDAKDDVDDDSEDNQKQQVNENGVCPEFQIKFGIQILRLWILREVEKISARRKQIADDGDNGLFLLVGHAYL